MIEGHLPQPYSPPAAQPHGHCPTYLGHRYGQRLLTAGRSLRWGQKMLPAARRDPGAAR